MTNLEADYEVNNREWEKVLDDDQEEDGDNDE